MCIRDSYWAADGDALLMNSVFETAWLTHDDDSIVPFADDFESFASFYAAFKKDVRDHFDTWASTKYLRER